MFSIVCLQVYDWCTHMLLSGRMGPVGEFNYSDTFRFNPLAAMRGFLHHVPEKTEGKSRCLSMEDVHAMLPLYQSETGTVLEPADINPVAVRHNRANIPKSRGRGCFLYASRTEKKTGSYVAICAQEYRPHMSTTPGSVRFGEVTSIFKHSFLDTTFTWVRVALYSLPQHDSPFWHSEDTSVETCLVESRFISHPLTCARACDERRIYFLNSKLLVI